MDQSRDNVFPIAIVNLDESHSNFETIFTEQFRQELLNEIIQYGSTNVQSENILVGDYHGVWEILGTHGWAIPEKSAVSPAGQPGAGPSKKPKKTPVPPAGHPPGAGISKNKTPAAKPAKLSSPAPSNPLPTSKASSRPFCPYCTACPNQAHEFDNPDHTVDLHGKFDFFFSSSHSF